MDGSSDGLGVNAGELAAMVLKLSDMIINMAQEQTQTREVLADLLQNQKDLTLLLGEHAKQIADLQAKLSRPTVQ